MLLKPDAPDLCVEDGVFFAISRAFTYPDKHVRGLAYSMCAVARQGEDRFGLKDRKGILGHIESYLNKCDIGSDMGVQRRKLTPFQREHCLRIARLILISDGSFHANNLVST